MTRRETPEHFHALPEARQIEGMAALARAALPRFGLAGAELATVAYRENMTFRVEAGSRGRFALRIHQPHYRSEAAIESELAFMRELAARGVSTPEVVPAADGSFLVLAESPRVPEPRRCDLFAWIDGRPLRATGEAVPLATPELARIYREVGRQAAAIAHVAEHWERPSGFTRPAWDAEGIFGTGAHLGDFRRLPRLTAEQRELFEALAERLEAELEAFGTAPDRYGLAHGDLLPENILVCADGIRMIDFDDCGESWTLFELATAVFDLLGEPAFDPCLAALVEGYRERRALPEEHLARLPTFLLARALSYLGWSASRSHLEKARQIEPRLLASLEALAPGYLATGS